ncbi:unnamed protein product [Mucor circinelloides]|nr:hypothetical protein G6F42_012342 [Rhizopus arrhizus]
MSNEENQDTSRLGKTAEEFNKVAGKYIEGSVKAAVLPLLKKVFQQLLPDQTEAIEECYLQGRDYMDKHLKKYIPQIINDNGLVEKQNKLDQLLKDAEERERVNTHLLPTPNQVLLGTVYKAKQMELIRLQKMLDDITEENYIQMNAIRAGIKEKQEKEAAVNKEIKHFTKTIEYANSIPAEDLIAVMDELSLRESDS